MNKTLGIVALFIAVYISSCSSDTPNSSFLPNSKGASGELILILNEDHQNDVTGKVILGELQSPCEQFLTYEPEFDVDQFDPGNLSKLIKQFRNLIIVKIADQVKEPNTVYRRNIWAQGQLVVQINGRDTSEIISEFRDEAVRIKEAFYLEDRKRYAAINRGITDPTNQEKMKTKFDLSLDLPSDFFFAAEGEDHLWFKNEKMEYRSGKAYQVVQNIVIRVAPFNNDSAFSQQYIIQEANTKTNAIITSSRDKGLIIEELFDPFYKEINFKEKYGIELKALWKFEEPLMGGPYSSISIHDPKKNRIITVEGFMFAPKFNKREYMKRLETILYSLEF